MFLEIRHAMNPLRLFPGTQVVSLADIATAFQNDERHPERALIPRGSVGAIVGSVEGSPNTYRVMFPGFGESIVSFDQLAYLSKFKQQQDLTEAASDHDFLFDRVIYRCVIGSRAYGLNHSDSDVDYRGVYLPTAEMHWSLQGVPEQIDREETQESYWELEKLIQLGLKANPNVLECLYSPYVLHATDLARELLAMRGLFLSKLVYQTFQGYVISQFKKAESDLRSIGEVKWKHAMHLIRLMLAGVHILQHQEVMLDVGIFRDRLLALRMGEMSWDQVKSWKERLQTEFEDAFQTTRLPERPDYEAVNSFLIRARRAAIAENLP